MLFADGTESHIEAMSLGIERHNFVRTHDKIDLLVVRDGVEALERIRLEMPSAVILNVRLPNLTGLELCRKMRADLRLKSIPVIIFAEDPKEGQEDYAKASGAVHYLSGTFRSEEVVKLTAELVFPKA